jgi:hypothetical protein
MLAEAGVFFSTKSYMIAFDLPRYWKFSPIKLGKTLFSHRDWDRYSAQKKHSRKITASILTPFSELLPNLYYSPIKKIENIFIFKIARQQHP